MKLLPSAPKISSTTKKISADSIRSSDGTSGKGIYVSKKKLISVRSRVIKIEKILGAQNKLYEKQKKKASVEQEKETRSKKESNLEKKPEQEDKGSKNLLKGPKLGFLDRIKNFIGKLLVGFIAIRLLPYLPDLIRLLPKVVSVVDWVSDFGIGLVDGFGSFVKGAYDLRDKTIGFIDSFGGDFAVNLFTKFEGAVGKVIEAAIIVAMSSGGEGGLLDTGIDLLKDRFLGQGAQAAASQAGGTASQAAGVGAGAAAAIIGGVGLLSSALGEGAFQLRGKGREIEGSAKKNYEQHKDKWKIDPRRVLSWGLYQAARFGNTMLSTVGFLLDVVGAPFRYAIELIRYPFLSDADKKTQAKNLAKFDARIREDIRKALNMVTFGAAFKEKGSFGNMFGNDAAQKEMMGKMAGGGLTRGGEQVGSVTRGIKSQKTPPRVFAQKSKETKIQPGSDIGGEKNIVKVFPESKKSDEISPLTYVKGVNEKVSQMPFLGPIFGLAYKTLLGEKPEANDYKNTAAGLDKWVRYTFNLKGAKMRLAGGGEVDVDMLMKGENMTTSLTKNVEGIVSNKVNEALRDLQRQLGLKPQTGPAGVPGATSPGLEGVVNIQGGDADFWTLVAVASREDGEPQSWADVAQSIYNRLASGAYTGKTIKELILGQMQYEPTWKFPKPGATGKPNQEWYSIKDAASAGIAAGQSEAAMRKVAAAILDPSLQKNAREFIQGRTDFRGYSVSGGIQRKRGDNYYGWYNNYSANKIGSVPNFGATATGGGSGPGGTFVGGGTGSGYGAGGVKIAGDLGDYMKANRGIIGVTGSIHQHPRHPGQFTRGYFSYHNQNRALDIGGYGPNHPSSGGRDEQAPVIRSLLAWNKKNGYQPVEIIHGSPAFKGLGKYESASNALHSNHVHVAYAKGGRVSKLTHALIGEKGPEFILDTDTTLALEDNFPGFLDALNHAKYNDAIGVLRNYASYEAGADQTVQLTTNVINNIVQSQPQKSAVMVSGGGSMDDYGEALAAGQ